MIAVVEIKGGFGNQIFQYAFAKKLTDQGCKVFVNIQNNNLKNQFLLNYKHFGFSKASKLLIFLLKLLFKISKSNRTFSKLNFKLQNIFFKFSKLEDFENTPLKKLNHFDGYWQNIDILEEQKKYIISCLNNIQILKEFSKKTRLKGSTLVHVRRGDYLKVGEELKIDYYNNAIQYCNKNIKGFYFEVFTDDLNWVKKQKIFENCSKIHGPTQQLDKLLTDIYSMFNFENYILANSTFSLIPAILSESSTSTIIVPDPWFRHSVRNIGIKSNWKKFTNF